VGIALASDPQVTRGLLEQFCLALSDATGIETVPLGVASYRKLLEQVEAREVDFAWLPPIPALRATASGDVVPVAMPIRGGETSYYTALFGRADGKVRSVDDLKGARVGWVDPHSAAGYLIMREHLRRRAGDLASIFAAEGFHGTHDSVAAAVESRSVDVGASYAYFDAQGRVKRGGWGGLEVRIVERAGPIPNDMIAARRGLSDLLRRVVQSALIDVHNAPLRSAARLLLSADGFEVPAPRHLDPLRELVAALDGAGDSPSSLFPPLR
jgi:phosphonate transport system substrate-binding protein